MSELNWRLADREWLDSYLVKVSGSPVICEVDKREALYFNGKPDGLWLPVNPLEGRARFRCTVGIYPESGGGSEQRFLHAGSLDDERFLIELRMNYDNSWYLDICLSIEGETVVLRNASRVHPADSWYTVSVEFDGKGIVAEVDDSVDLVGTLTPSPGWAFRRGARCSVGMRQNEVSFFRGAMDRIVWE